MFFKLARLSFYLCTLAIGCALGLVLLVYYKVEYGDHTALKKTAILSKIKEETTLYYHDESTTIGSIFDSKHRRYVAIEEIPAFVLNAVVAAEDKNFYTHFGIDPLAISKAVASAIIHKGRFRRGGSTITQQTVKNIVDDWEASFARKFREMVRALQLEKLYSKDQILEFYLNQFHVVGNGNGIGIAAKYYFNKDVQDLTLVEGAFIAGSLKGPGKYNPFIKYTKKNKDLAKEHAFERKNYVIGRMFEQKWISENEYQEALKAQIPFSKGEFRNSEVSLVDLVKLQLQKKEILQAIGLRSVKDLNVAGFKVYTTLDGAMQKAAQLAMRRNLSRVETILNGFSSEPEEKYQDLRTLKKDSFVYGRVEAIRGADIKSYSLDISFGYPKGKVSNASLVRYAKLLSLADRKGYGDHLKNMMSSIKKGDILYLQVLSYDNKKHEAHLELQKRPKVSGGMMALDNGEVRAIVSGFDTLGYNRALFAKRQPGSVFKSLAFVSAMQLGWSIFDRIDNIRRVFPYQGEFYYPRPDHLIRYNNASMLWTGIMSENLASVSIVTKMLEKLSFDQFKELLHFLDLSPKTNEKERDFHYRVSRKTGVSLNKEGIKEQQLVKAINDITPDLIFAQENETLVQLKQMWWGRGTASEIIRLLINEEDELSTQEIYKRISFLENNFLHYGQLYEQLHKDWKDITTSLGYLSPNELINHPEQAEILSRFRIIKAKNHLPKLAYFIPQKIDEEEILKTLDPELNITKLVPLPESPGKPLTAKDIEDIWISSSDNMIQDSWKTLEGIYLHGLLQVPLFEKLKELVEEKFEDILKDSDSYRLSQYFQHHDFRTAVALRYITTFAKECGIYNAIKPVLSLSLGTSDVTVSEVAKLYQTFKDGKTYQFFKEGPKNQISFIKRIEDRFGNILYKPEVKIHQLIPSDLAGQMSELLRRTVSHGTGRRARGELYVNNTKIKGDTKKINVRVPAYGKTGTTNDFTTSYFAGLLPYPDFEHDKQSLDVKNSYAISAYIGYDFNKNMKNGRQKIYGGNGALPMWTEFAKQILKIKEYEKYLDFLDISVLSKKEWPLKYDSHYEPYLVNLPRGVILREGQEADYDVFQTTNLSLTGEQFQNLFMPDKSLNTILYLPKESVSQNWQINRQFKLYDPSSSYEEGNDDNSSFFSKRVQK